MEPLLCLHEVSFGYQPGQLALDGVSLDIRAGEYVAIVGHNGSGKSTLAKHLNALLVPRSGRVWVDGLDTSLPENRRRIRHTVGMVFQVPDNQIVATIVEEDVAFGPENLGLPHREIVERVGWALERVEMEALRRRAPHLLSAGQKQRVAIAGALALRPKVLVLDEATSMLDPAGREEVLRTVGRLHREEGVTVVAITHVMEEAALAERVVVMEGGRIVLEGVPREVFGQSGRLHELGLGVPVVTELSQRLAARVAGFPSELLGEEELVEAVAVRYEGVSA